MGVRRVCRPYELHTPDTVLTRAKYGTFSTPVSTNPSSIILIIPMSFLFSPEYDWLDKISVTLSEVLTNCDTF